MNLSKIFKTIRLHLTGLTLSGVVFLPFPSQAVEFPASPAGGFAPHRSAAAAPKRCIHDCITESYDFNDNGQLDQDERVTPVTVIAPEGNVITSGDGTLRLVVYMPELRTTFAEVIVDRRIPVPGTENKFRYQEVYFNDAIALPPDLQAGPRLVSLTIDDLQLEPGETYVWSLSFGCGENDWASVYSTVEGLVTVSDENAAFPDGVGLNTSMLVQTAQRYADRQLWSETLHLTAQLRQSRPDVWANLLESQGLGCFKDVPFAGEDTDFTIEDDPRCFVE
ncbi:MAG: DUF928 domain-containing protein [Spirulinaceae cyanobacterium]